MPKVLIICGPTATGKTELALEIAAKYSGEIISADSRQVYIGMDIITGKDIPSHFTESNSHLIWHGRPLTYHTDGHIRIWLSDVVFPNESFNVSFFNDCSHQIISDIHARGKLPIIVGVTGLYIKSLVTDMPDIHAPYNQKLRSDLKEKSVEYLFYYLNLINPDRAVKLNYSDRWNPRRLIRAIEISQSVPLPTISPITNFLQLCLLGNRQLAYARIDKRVLHRITAGAESEVATLIAAGFSWDLPALRTSGVYVWRDFFAGKSTLEQVIQTWQNAEHGDFRQQLSWFTKQQTMTILSVDTPDYTSKAKVLIDTWYNNSNA